MSITDFYTGLTSDHRGRTLDDILVFDDEQLEDVHDYIQWLFPLTEPSRFNRKAPVLTVSDIAEFRADEALKARVLDAFGRMLCFYGLESKSGPNGLVIHPSPEFAERARVWMTRGNHNYLRITRILTSLRLLGLDRHSEALLACLRKLYEADPDSIGRTTMVYWSNTALQRQD